MMDRFLFMPKEWSTLKKLIALKAGAGGGLNEYTVNGNPAVFDTNVAKDLTGLVIPFAPVQDLHGQSNPYPAGGGVNKIPYPYYTADGTISGVAFSTASDGKIIATGTTVAGLNYFLARDMTLNAGTYTVSVSGTHTTLTLIARDPVNNVVLGDVTPAETSVTFTISETTSVRLYFNTSVVGASVSISAYVQLESGNQPTSYAPYSNICPISGWTGCNVTRTGVNLLPPTNYKPNLFTIAEDGSITQNNPSSTSFGWTYANSALRVKLKPGTYTVSVTVVSATTNTSNGVIGYSADDSVVFARLDLRTVGVKSATFTLTAETELGLTYKLYDSVVKICIVSGSTATAYEPYQGETYPITWEEAGTVYGGELDAVNGKLIATHRFVTLDGVTNKCTVGYGNSGPNYYPAYSLGTGVNKAAASGNKVISSYLKPVNYATSQNSIAVGNSGQVMAVHIGTIQGTDGTYGYNSAQEVIAAANAYLAEHNLQICYELAESLEFDLDPLTVQTLIGTNVIASDTNGTNEITYLKKG